MTFSATRISFSIRLSMVALSLLAGSCVAHAQSTRAVPDVLFDEDKVWSEQAVNLPPAPKAASLIEFAVGPSKTLRFAIDTDSLSIGSDDVVHYTLVATSSSGVRNVSFEGIRCTTFEIKHYAFGRDDGSWVQSQRNAWSAIQTANQNSAQATLARDFFCRGNAVDGRVPNLLRKFRNESPRFD